MLKLHHVLSVCVRKPSANESSARCASTVRISNNFKESVCARAREMDIYLFPCKRWRSMMAAVSSLVKLPLLRSGLR